MTFLDANSYAANNKPVNIAQVLILKLYLQLTMSFFFKKIHCVFIFITEDYYKRKVKPELLHLSLFTNYR